MSVRVDGFEKYDGLTDRTCPICGRNFIPAPYHVYRVNNVLVCTYTCMRKGEREKLKPKNEAHVKPVYMFSIDGAFIGEYPHAAAAASVIGIRSETIRRCSRGETESAGGFAWSYEKEGRRKHENDLSGS